MVNKSLLAVSLALLAIGVGRPAQADPKFLEAYPDIFGARTFLGSPSDSRPKDAYQNQESGEGNARKRAFIVGAFGRFTGSDFPPYTAVGGGVGYADVSSAAHPWEVKVQGYDYNPHRLGFIDPADRLGLDATAKFVVWQSAHSYLPVISLVGRYRNINGFFNRWDAGIALDQKIVNHLYVTGNAGYGTADYVHSNIVGNSFNDHSAFVSGAGLTWEIGRKLSLAGNYVPDNAVENEDFWAAALTYAVNNDLAISGGGGKHKTFFAQVTYKIGKRGEATSAAQQK